MTSKNNWIYLLIISFVIIVSFSRSDNTSNNDLILNDTTKEGKDFFSHTDQFHWPHMPITYSYDTECEFKIIYENGSSLKVRDESVLGQIEKGLTFIAQRTNGAITFKEITRDKNPDIYYICDSSNRNDYLENSNFLPYYSQTLGEAQPNYYIGTNLFAPGEVYLIRLGKEICAQTRPIIVIHETLHMLGLEHRNFIHDIMHPSIRDDCNLDISKRDLDYLWSIYDPNNLYKPYKSKFNCEMPYYSCSDFDYQKEAQEVLEFCGLDSDIHKLDSDRDSLACENLP